MRGKGNTVLRIMLPLSTHPGSWGKEGFVLTSLFVWLFFDMEHGAFKETAVLSSWESILNVLSISSSKSLYIVNSKMKNILRFQLHHS